MICSVRTMCIRGIQGNVVTAEAYISNGMPGFEIVGLPDAAVKEARERVRAAVRSSGMNFPVSRITVNLAPASLKKSGTHFDLPILLAILAASGQVRRPRQDCAFLGEVALDGTVRRVSGVLPMVLAAKREGIRSVFVPAENAAEATLAHGPAVYPISSIRQLADGLNGEIQLREEPIWVPNGETAEQLDFKDVLGQEKVKRALEVAAAGGHNVLLIGPPGSGKSMLSKRLPSILPDMTWEEALEVTQVYSVLGLLSEQHPLVAQRPFRAPHHTLSASAMTGGGQTPKPGEISLAHHGVLFLDELPEFHRDVLEVLRAPIEDGEVTITRAAGSITLPSRFMLVGAMNPCRCGWYGHPSGRCRCTKQQVEKYVEKISGPMLDRMDLHVNVPSVEFEAMRRREKAESSADVKARVNAARDIQKQRFSGTNITCNAQMIPAMVGEFCTLDAAGEKLLKGAFERLGLTARSHDRLLRVARTIADLDGSEKIEAHHLAEAIQYRNTDILQG